MNPGTIWRTKSGQLRAIWQVAMLVMVVGVVANPLVLLLDATDIPVVENSLKNVCILIGVLVALWLITRLQHRPLADIGIGLKKKGFLKRLVIGVAVGGGILCGIVMTGVVMGWYQFEFQPQTRFACSLWLAMLGQTIRYMAGSIFEESVSRGWLFGLVHQLTQNRSIRTRNSIALLATSLIFGVLHFGNPDITVVGMANLTLLGVLFGLLYLISGDLHMPIGAHFAWNVFQNNIFGLPNSGQPSNASIFFNAGEASSLASGGTFGPEGSVLTTVVLLAIVAGLWRRGVDQEIGSPRDL